MQGATTSRRPFVLLGALLAFASSSCAETLADGALGTPRMVGYVRGTPPDVAVLPPVSDRAGNLYVLAGSRNLPEANVFVGRAGGGFSSGCRLTKGDRVGPLGWVGFAQERQWYWSGGALVSVTAAGDCRRVLDRDPSSGTDLQFRAIFPWVADRPSRTSAVALVQSPADPLPFTVRLDLEAGIYTTPRAFVPEDARDLVVHGVGASAALREGYLVASFTQGESIRVEARFYDEDGVLTSRVGIPDPGEIPPFGIRGYLQANDAGLVAGLTEDKRLVLFDRASARVVGVDGLDPVGVHVWDGALFLVGTAGGGPVVAPILDSGAVGAPVAWVSSQALARAFGRPIEVTDDRAPPRRTTRLGEPRVPSGPFPLLTDHTSHRYAEGTTLVLVGGPTIGEGPNAFTLLAVAPAGVSYP